MANEFCTIADVKALLGLSTNNAFDAVLTPLITQVSEFIRTYLSRDIYPVTAYSKTLNGTGKTVMPLVNYPLVAVSSLLVDGVAIPAQPAVNQSGYVLDDNCIRLVGYCFNKGVMNVSVSYTANYAAIPDDIKRCCIEWTAVLFNERTRLGVAGKTIGNETISYSVLSVPKAVKMILDQWKGVIPHVRG